MLYHVEAQDGVWVVTDEDGYAYGADDYEDFMDAEAVAYWLNKREKENI